MWLLGQYWFNLYIWAFSIYILCGTIFSELQRAFSNSKNLLVKIASNVTEKLLSTVFRKSAEEKTPMLECNFAYIANWHFGSDYIDCRYCTTESYSDSTQENENYALCNI